MDPQIILPSQNARKFELTRFRRPHLLTLDQITVLFCSVACLCQAKLKATSVTQTRRKQVK